MDFVEMKFGFAESSEPHWKGSLALQGLFIRLISLWGEGTATH